MNCQKCAHEATVHFTEVDEGVCRDLHFCGEHGEEYARTVVPVEVTQSQIDNKETIEVKLPHGGTATLKLSKDIAFRWPMVTIRSGKGDCGPRYVIRMRRVG